MTQEMIDVCNKVNAELQQERYNAKMTLIARCFEYDKFLAADEKSLRVDRLYYNSYFDMLYDMPYYKLEEWEQKMFKIVKDYEESIATRQTI